jgi:hypothetical protein
MDPWLRGPVPGIPALFQPAAHALIQALEDAERGLTGLSPAQVWERRGGAASVGFHARHLAGALDRLFTYAEGRGLDEAQRQALALENAPGDPPESAESLVQRIRSEVNRALQRLRAIPGSAALEPREVGRQRLPTTVLGALFHGAEHAARHAGQLVTTSRVVRGDAPANGG